jgi:3-hydroxyacyl-CoA dehydrogenase/enoyl-CoA hydratase/3-hydroxybutyryl-CoA epimerase
MATTLPDLHDWRFTVDFEGIAWAVIDRKGESMNSLGRRPTEELGEIIKAVEAAAPSGEIKGLVLMSGKERSFIAGADIREFESFDTEPKITEVVKETLELFNHIDRLRSPWSPPLTAIAWVADLSWRWPATGASPIARRALGSASPRSSSASSPV